MKLLTLAARIARAYSQNASNTTRTVQKVKNGEVRDVVTELDYVLHGESVSFAREQLEGCRLLSEEDVPNGWKPAELCRGQWLVVDPLDGSHNYATGMPGYGYMAAQLQDGCITGAVIVLPEQAQYIVFEGGEILYANSLPVVPREKRGTVYYAYPPAQSVLSQEIRKRLMGLIDAESAGMYRYGSACVGLYNLLCGRHMAFIGHRIRIWDALAFLPLLETARVPVRYDINSEGLTIVAGKDEGFVEQAVGIFKEAEGIDLIGFEGGKLRVDAR